MSSILKLEITKIKEKYPNKIPILVYKDKNSKNTPDIDKNKFLVPNDMIFGKFIYVIRKRLSLKQSEAIFLYINNVIPPTGESLNMLYNKYKNKNEFLEIIYTTENTFG